MRDCARYARKAREWEAGRDFASEASAVQKRGAKSSEASLVATRQPEFSARSLISSCKKNVKYQLFAEIHSLFQKGRYDGRVRKPTSSRLRDKPAGPALGSDGTDFGAYDNDIIESGTLNVSKQPIKVSLIVRFSRATGSHGLTLLHLARSSRSGLGRVRIDAGRRQVVPNWARTTTACERDVQSH